MAKLSWNGFNQKYKKPVGYIAKVSSTLPKGLQFDRSHKKLPTPYGLFQEWATKSLSGDWTSSKFKGGFIICVKSPNDIDLISKKFGTFGEFRNTEACARTMQMKYRDSNYGPLAKELGYNI